MASTTQQIPPLKQPSEELVTQTTMDDVEKAIDYQFNDKALLRSALTAAGANKDSLPNNKALARMGHSAIELVVARVGFEKGESQEWMNHTQRSTESKERLIEVAKQTGIASCIKYGPSSDSGCIKVLSVATQAVLGAAYMDCDFSYKVAARIVKRINPSLDTCRDPVNGNIGPPEGSRRFMEGRPLGPPAESHCLDPGALDDGMAPADVGFPELEIFLNTTPSPETLSATVDPLWNDVVEFIQPSSIMNSNMTSASASLELSDRSYTKGVAVDDPIDPQAVFKSGTLPALDTVSQFSNAESHDGLLTPESLDSTRFVATKSRSKRRRICPRSGTTEWLELYIQSEQRRCVERGTSALFGDFLDQQWLNEIVQSAYKHPDTLLRIWVSISSAHSVVALRETLTTIKNEDGLQFQKSLYGFSRAERVQMIEKNDRHITAIRLLNRCHALKLWEDRNVGSDSELRWLVVDSQNGPGPKRPGNPINISRCQATKALVEILCPGMEEKTPEYEEKFHHVRRLEKLGQRLSMLTRQYGQGILGLLQGSGVQSAVEEPMDISDQMILQPSDAEFKQFLDTLERGQGELLQSFSKAAAPTIEHIQCGTATRSSPIQAEFVEPGHILGLPKGSPALLELLYQVPG